MKYRRSSFVTRRSLLGLFAALASVSALRADQEAAATTTASDEVVQLEKFVSIGSRFKDRTVVDSPVPIDTLTQRDLTQNGYTEIAQALSTLVPSLIFTRPANADGTDSILPATLRGLGPDQTLVLLNGKRYHTSALVNLNGSVGRGSAAVDLNTIPSFALGGAEVLRDGASAQYGSDAIAGVINLSLRNDPGFALTSTVGETYKHDGAVFESSAAYGTKLGTQPGGYLSVTATVRDRGYTNRAGLDARQQYFGTNSSGVLVTPGSVANVINGTADAREASFKRLDQIQGDPTSHSRGLSLNASLPITPDVTGYLFGTTSYNNSTSYATWRRPADSTNVRAIYPDGFQPQINPHIFDLSLTGGAKGQAAGWNWDLSQTWGQNTIQYYTRHSLNVTYGTSSQTDFYDGKLGFGQAVTNLDISRSLDVGLPNPLKTAFGAEYRWEDYTIDAGEHASWDNGGQLILDGPSKGGTPAYGAQGFPGFRPSDVTDSSRGNIAGYADFETNLTKAWSLDVAARGEHYSDAGSTLTGKLASRYELPAGFSLRGSLSNGFRTPALQQEYFTTTSTTQISISGVNTPVEVKTFQVNNPAAIALGATPLKPEKSFNGSLGLAYGGKTGLSASVDYYNIFIKDRVVLSSNFTGTSVSTYLASQGYPGLGGGRYFTNGIDTRTQGVDLTSSYTWKLAAHDRLTLSLAYNYNQTRVTYIKATPATVLALTGGTPIFDRQNTLRFEQGTPHNKTIFSASYDLGHSLSINAREIRYGKVLSAGSTAALDQELGESWVTDLEIAYHLNSRITVAVGANNLFNEYPDKLNALNNTSGVNQYSNFSPGGFNGGFYYTRVDVKF